MGWHPCKECGKSHPFKVTAARPCPNSSRGGVGANTLTGLQGVRPARANPKASRSVDVTPRRGVVATGNNQTSAGVAPGPRGIKSGGRSSMAEPQPSNLKTKGSTPSGRSISGIDHEIPPNLRRCKNDVGASGSSRSAHSSHDEDSRSAISGGQKETTRPGQKKKPRSSAVEQGVLNPKVPGSNPGAAAKKSKYRDSEKRRVYMRDLMRKRRKAAKKVVGKL